jgi:putative aldouronate transport system substrate-binding protein
LCSLSQGATREETEQQGRGGVSTSNINAPGVFPICKEPITLTVGIRPDPNVENYETNALTKYYEEKGNFSLQFELFSGSGADANQKLQVMAASDVVLPEVLINFGLSDQIVTRLGEDGIILPLDDYYKNLTYYIPQQMEKMANKDLLNWAHSYNGHIYYVAGGQEQLGEIYALRGWINTTWLDNLGLQMPTTTDEFQKVMTAFANNDPNRNGKKDEYAISGDNSERGRTYDFLLNAFIYNNSRNRLIVDDNGKIDTIVNKPEYREGLRWINSLVKEGLFLPQIFTQNQASSRGMIEAGDVSTVGFFCGGLAGCISANNPRRLEYAPMPPLKGPKGVEYTPYWQNTPAKTMMITKYCKNPEAAFRWGDLIASEESSIWNRFGVPDKDWKQAGPGDKSMYTDLGFKATLILLNNVWSGIQNSHWYMSQAGLMYMGLIDGMVQSMDNPLENERWIAAAVPLHIGKEPPEKNRVDHMIFSFEETEKYGELRSSFNTYVDESLAFFVTGEKNIDRDWDAYIRELDTIGLKDFLAVSQSGYERAIGKK